jgi:hypothetical protein
VRSSNGSSRAKANSNFFTNGVQIILSTSRTLWQKDAIVLTLPSECVSLNRPVLGDIEFIPVVVGAVEMRESASSISKVCWKGGKQHHRFPGFP